jgi:heat shock protein HtpX
LRKAKLMDKAHDTFRQLEHTNRRKTVELVAILVLIYAVVGFILDFIFHSLRLVNRHLTVVPWTGIPWLMIAAVAIALAEALWAYYRGSSVIIGAVRGDDLTAESVKEQTVLDVVNEMALAAHIPVPRICLMEDPAPNAFATGRDPEHSVICVTRGLVDQLDREELQGAIAHEIAHIRGHDTRVTQMAVVMVGGFSLVTGSVMRFMRAIQVRRPGNQGGTEAAIPGIGIITIPLLILGGLGWIFSKMVAISLSRQREYLADAAAVEITRNPLALIRALEHIARIESPLKATLRGVAPLFIVDPFECSGAGWVDYLDQVTRIEGQQDKTKEQRDAEAADFIIKGMPQYSFRGSFSSHPPIRDRVARLQALLHGAAGVPAESPAEIDARRKAATKVVIEATQNNPDAAAAFLESIIQANPGQQLREKFAEILPASGLISAAPSGDEQTFANPADQAAYQKLYEYNLRLTADKDRFSAARGLPADSPLAALISGQSVNIDPAQLRTAFAAGMATVHHKPAAAIESGPGVGQPAKKHHYLFWLVIALSAGAIIASFAIK